MNWKEFLKPSWQKCAVFVIFLTIVPPAIVYVLFTGCYTGCGNINFATWQIAWDLTFRLIFVYISSIPILLIIPGISILISYLLACLLASIYSKFSKRKK